MSEVAAHFISCLDRAEARAFPFSHWLLSDVLPDAMCVGIDALPVAPAISGDTQGKRETNNSLRVFFGAAQRSAWPACQSVAAGLQNPIVARQLEHVCGITLAGSYLRIEYCLDTQGFWLEPHTDIGAKLLTMLIYLSDTPGCEAWGTDLLDSEKRLVATTPYHRNDGFMFIPGSDTWHGFRERPIRGVRRSLIVNYVIPEWRSRHELAFPQEPVGGA